MVRLWKPMCSNGLPKRPPLEIKPTQSIQKFCSNPHACTLPSTFICSPAPLRLIFFHPFLFSPPLPPSLAWSPYPFTEASGMVAFGVRRQAARGQAGLEAACDMSPVWTSARAEVAAPLSPRHGRPHGGIAAAPRLALSGAPTAPDGAVGPMGERRRLPQLAQAAPQQRPAARPRPLRDGPPRGAATLAPLGFFFFNQFSGRVTPTPAPRNVICRAGSTPALQTTISSCEKLGRAPHPILQMPFRPSLEIRDLCVFSTGTKAHLFTSVCTP